MKKVNLTVLLFSVFAVLTIITGACTKNLLDQQPTTEMGAASFWLTEDDATTALIGAYSAIRPCFDRDYFYEGHAEFVRSRGTSASSSNLQKGLPYYGGVYNPSGYGNSFDKMYQYLYGGVNRTNYVIENVNKMLPNASAASKPKLEAVVGEARLLRGMAYFRLISMWGDVPYIGKIIYSNDEVASLARIPMTQIKDSIMADFTYAFEKLPAKPSAVGRAGKPAALAFRGKLQLFWACWNKFGWPELDTFTPSLTEADAAYKASAADFKAVIENYGLALFRNGEPGAWGTMGSAEVLPNYFYLFTPQYANANTEGEMIMLFTHGGVNTGLGEELMRDFAGRSHENSQCQVHPRYELADRYQSTITGDFVTPLIPTNASLAGARTKLNSAVNPASYANRDYRMKGTMMWDYEMSMGVNNRVLTGWCPFIYKTWNGTVKINDVNYFTYNTDACNSGYVFRKFVRDYAGQIRNEGDYNWPVIRLADVYLMYAEATNEAYGPQADAIAWVNRVRHRGNLPELKAEKTATKAAFFDAIEQERIIELVGEGQRSFDLRRWRAIERVWGPPYGNGKWTIDTHGAQQTRYFQNLSELEYQRCYIFSIPSSERDRNPNLTQNKPWL